MPAEPFLVLDRLEKRFGEQPVIRRLSLSVAEGEMLALLGPSGSGKTTLLRLLAGFETPDAGAIRVGGSDVAHLPPAKRRFGMVFQHFALFPHLTVGENVAFGLAGAPDALPKDEVAPRVAEMLRLVDLAGFEKRRVGEISGGQQQRVALARALAPSPRLLLLDEPLSNLDPTLRERTRRELKATVQKVGITTVLVTHEQEEAFDLGDRVAVLHDGQLDQIGAPEALYSEPATRFVATFVGRAGVLLGTYVDGDSGPAFEPAPGAPRWRCRAGDADGYPSGTPVELVVRPESLRLTQPGAEGSRPGTAVDRRFTGLATYVTVRLDAGSGEAAAPPELEILLHHDEQVDDGETVAVIPSGSGPLPRAFRREPGGSGLATAEAPA